MPKMTREYSVDVLESFGLTTPGLELEDGSNIRDLEVVRYVPSRRCVCRGVWQGVSVYVKLFFGPKAQHYAQRDLNGVHHFNKAAISTPKILLHSELRNAHGVAIVFEAIDDAKNAEDFWVESNEQSRLMLAKQLMRVLAEHHNAGLLQTDLYLKNFLVDSNAIYSIDGDGVRVYDALTKQYALRNLCQLLSKFDVLMLSQQLPALLQTYSDARLGHFSLALDDVQRKVDSVRIKAVNAYAEKKVFRQCTDVNVENGENKFIAIRSAFSNLSLPKTVVELDGYFKPENIIKNGNTCTVASVKMDQHSLVIKRYNIKGFWHGVGRAFRQTRAAVSWANAHRLQLLDLDTAHPVALIESRVFGLKGKAYFLAEHLDVPDMSEFFQRTSNKALRAAAVKHTVELFYRLYLLKISHGDMKATNIKVLASGKPSLIDLDCMKQHQNVLSAKKAHARDIKRFMQNWKGQPSLYNAFIKAFKVVYADQAPLQAAQILE